jgi:hypothetical protein
MVSEKRHPFYNILKPSSHFKKGILQESEIIRKFLARKYLDDKRKALKGSNIFVVQNFTMILNSFILMNNYYFYLNDLKNIFFRIHKIKLNFS